jgi:membrane-associated phospholipid phosphatase
LLFTVAIVVAVSRAYVRIHHASDVLGGAVLGAALAQAALAIVRAV